jgi:hypothetical protein
MPVIELTEEQVRQLVLQLPEEQRKALVLELLRLHWQEWTRLSESGQEHIRRIARERGLDWDQMSEEEREALIDQILHEP